MSFSVKKKGFTLIEILVVIAIIGILSVVVLASLNRGTSQTRDTKRKVEITQIGRLLTGSCYLPNAGIGEYDIMTLVPELSAKYPQFINNISQIPKDPLSGSNSLSRYLYIVNGSNQCAVYANLENQSELVTLNNISSPTPGGGTGVFVNSSIGWNGSTKYFQVSN